MSLAWVWFLIAAAAFTWASWLHMLLADANAEVARLDWDNAELRTNIDALNNPDLAIDLADIDPDHPGWQRLYDAVLDQASADATWDEAAHQRHQAEQIERAKWTPEETALGEQVDAMFEGGEAL